MHSSKVWAGVLCGLLPDLLHSALPDEQLDTVFCC